MRLGIIGTGNIVDMIFPHLAEWELPIELVAIAGTPRSAEKVSALAERYGIPHAYTNWRELVACPEVEVVYIGAPNSLHLEMGLASLAAGKHVICEKPLAVNARESAKLAAAARERGLFLWEAIVTPHQPNFRRAAGMLPRLGDIKIAIFNYTQYSSRYDAFRAGTVLPAFDPAKAGGALMDLGVYSISYAVNLFGEPRAVSYHANIEREIDTSGVAVLDYDGFVAVCICSKDCDAPAGITIQGTLGCLVSDSTPWTCGSMELRLHGGEHEPFDESTETPWETEFRDFVRQWEEGDLESCYAQLERSLAVSRVMSAAREQAGIRFPSDALTGTTTAEE